MFQHPDDSLKVFCFDVTFPNITKQYSQLIIDTNNLQESTHLDLLQVDMRTERTAQLCGVGCSFSLCRYEKPYAREAFWCPKGLLFFFWTFLLVAYFLSFLFPFFLSIKIFLWFVERTGKAETEQPIFYSYSGPALAQVDWDITRTLAGGCFYCFVFDQENSTYFYLAFRFLPTGVCVCVRGRHDRGQLYTTHTLFLGGLQLSREITAQKRTERGCLAWWYLASCVFPVTPYVQRPEIVAFFFFPLMWTPVFGSFVHSISSFQTFLYAGAMTFLQRSVFGSMSWIQISCFSSVSASCIQPPNLPFPPSQNHFAHILTTHRHVDLLEMSVISLFGSTSVDYLRLGNWWRIKT